MLWLNIRFALRLLRRTPGFTAAVLALLVLGIGVTTAMFSLVECLVLRPLPYPRSEELSVVWSTQWTGPESTSVADFLDWHEQGADFAGLAAIDATPLSLSTSGEKADHVQGAAVTEDFFSVFGLPAKAGRLLGPEDAGLEAPKTVVLSATLWRDRFSARADVIGSTVKLDGESFTVVGVAAEGFRFGSSYSDGCDVWIPLRPTRNIHDRYSTGARGTRFLQVIARRKSSVSAEHANAQMASIAKGLEARYPDTNGNRGARLVGLQETLVGKSRGGAWILFAAVAFVYLIVCANVANLLLIRATGRRGEMAVRVALGALGGQLVRQLITETLVLFLLGAVGGAGFAGWLIHRLSVPIVAPEARGLIRLDGVALLFCIGLCVASGILIGLTPALTTSKVGPQGALKESSIRSAGHVSHHRVRSGLVIVQFAFAFTLLAGSGLMLRAYTKLAATPPGFVPDDVTAATIVLPAAMKDGPQSIGFLQRLLGELEGAPDVESMAVTSTLPMTGSNMNSHFGIEGRPPWQPGEGPIIEHHAVTPGYFRTMGIPLLRGRDITPADTADARRVLIINERAASTLFPGEDPLGKRLAWSGDDEHPEWREIIGVVGDVRHRGLSYDLPNDGYIPFVQEPSFHLSVVAKTRTPAAFGRELTDAMYRIDPGQAIWRIRSMQSYVDGSIQQARSQTIILALFAAAALFLASLGLFALISYSTGQRSREFAIRSALGATPSGIVVLVMRGGFRVIAAGTVLGLVGALFTGRVLGSNVAGVAAFDFGLFGFIPMLLGLAGALACIIPAWRAVRVPPAVALRYE